MILLCAKCANMEFASEFRNRHSDFLPRSLFYESNKLAYVKTLLRECADRRRGPKWS